MKLLTQIKWRNLSLLAVEGCLILFLVTEIVLRFYYNSHKMYISMTLISSLYMDMAFDPSLLCIV